MKNDKKYICDNVNELSPQQIKRIVDMIKEMIITNDLFFNFNKKK